MDANVIAAREVYDLMVRGEIAQSQVRCREFLVDHPNDFLIDLLYTKSVELSANYPEAIRSYLALIALLKDGKTGGYESFTESVMLSLANLCEQIIQKLDDDKGAGSGELLIACYDVVLTQLSYGKSGTQLMRPDTLLKFAIVLLEANESAMFFIAATMICDLGDEHDYFKLLLCRDLACRGRFLESIHRVGASKAIRSLKPNSSNFLALYVLISYAYHKGKYGLIERIIMRIVRKKLPFAQYKSISQYYMLRTSKRFFANCVVNQKYEIDYAAFQTAEFKSEFVILVSCDEIYYRRAAAAFVLEILDSGENITVHLNVVDPTPETSAELLSLSGKHCTFGFSTFYSESIQKSKVAKENKFEALKALYACGRLLIMPRILREYNRKVIVLDSDHHIAKSLEELLGRLSERFVHDFAIATGPTFGPGIDYYADKIAFSNSLSGTIYAQLVCKYVLYFLRNEFCFWTLDQVALLAVHAYLRSVGHNPSVYPLNKDDLQISDYLSHYGAQHIRCERPNVTF